MAVHPKIGVFGAALGIVVCGGVGLFLVGRLTSAAPLVSMLIGVAGGLGVLSLIGVAVFRSLPVGRRLDGLLLDDTQPSWDGYISAAPRSELVGRTGTAATELRPSGVADIDGERVDVTTDGEWLPVGTVIKVVKAEAMRVVVRRAPQVTA